MSIEAPPIKKRGPPKGVRVGGRQKGSKNLSTIQRELQAAQALIARRRAPPTDGIELAKDALERAMKMAEGVASLHCPPSSAQIEAAAGQGKTLPLGDWGLFGDWFDRWTFCMKALAPYQSPQLRAVMLSQPEQSQTIENEREPADAAERLERATRTYLTLVKSDRAA